MAISTKGTEFQWMVRAICWKHDIDPSRYISMAEHPFDDSLEFKFAPEPLPPALVGVIASIKARLGDEFRSEVIRVAVPELHKDLTQLLKVAGTSNTLFFRYQREDLFKLMSLYRNHEKTNSSTHHQTLHQPGGSADRHIVVGVPSVHSR